MIIEGRDPELPSPIFNNPRLCQHPHSRVNFTGHFPEDDPMQSVFTAHCYECGSKWDHNSPDAPWDTLMLKLGLGEFGVVSNSDLEIGHKVQWRHTTRYNDILKDAAGGTGNPIEDMPAVRPIE